MKPIVALAVAGFFDFVRSRIFATIFAAGIALVIASLVFQELAASQESRVLIDVGLAFIALVSVALAAIVPLSTVAREIDTRQVHLVLARPISRAAYVSARFLASAALIVITNVALGAVLAGLLVVTGAANDAPTVLLAAIFNSFEALIIVSFAILFGVNSSVAVSSLLIILVFILGRLAYALDAVITAKLDGTTEQLALLATRLLPAFGRFDLTPALHGVPLDGASLLRSAAYGLVYAAAVLSLAAWRLQKRDLI